MRNQFTKSVALCEGGGPRLPNGQVVGAFFEEEGVPVWERRITHRHVLRVLDALTVNAGLMRQIRAAGRQLLRYTLEHVGTYEVALVTFLEKCSILQCFAAGEDVYALPRSEWRFMPANEQLGLFGFEDRP